VIYDFIHAAGERKILSILDQGSSKVNAENLYIISSSIVSTHIGIQLTVYLPADLRPMESRAK
jgi:hypothetical protein